MALVFVLWVMTILCALAIQVRFTSHLRVQATAYTGMSTKAHYLSRAGIARAMADMDYESDTIDLYEDYYVETDDDERYCNVELGDGTYTLYAGTDPDGEPVYGMVDESARINVNVLDREVLEMVPNVGPELARLIERGRKRQPYANLSDLLKLPGIDETILYGEDLNENGLLDPNEDDGDQSWPTDNEDGRLDRGLAAYLTTWSAAKNVTWDGQERVDITKASADDIAQKVEGISEQQAHSIVAHRDKNKFNNITDLLDVDLVELVQKKNGDNDKKGSRGRGNQRPAGQPKQNGKGKTSARPTNPSSPTGDSSNKGAGRKDRNDGRDQPQSGSKNSKTSNDKGKNKQQYKSTGKKAFDVAGLKSVADSVTIIEDEVRKGVVNVNEASVEVLACLPKIDEALAAEIVNTRENSEETFSSIADLLDIKGMSTNIFEGISNMISVRSDVFSIRSFGVVGDVYVCNMAVIDRTEDEMKLVYWREIE